MKLKLENSPVYFVLYGEVDEARMLREMLELRRRVEQLR